MNNQIEIELINNSTDYEKLNKIIKKNNIDIFYTNNKDFDLPCLILIMDIINGTQSINNMNSSYSSMYKNTDLLERSNLLNIPYGLLLLLNSQVNNKIKKNIELYMNKDNLEEGTFLLFTKQQKILKDLSEKFDLLDKVYNKKISNFLKTNLFFYLYNFNISNFTDKEKMIYNEYYCKDLLNIFENINIKNKFDNKSLKKLQLGIYSFMQNNLTIDKKELTLEEEKFLFPVLLFQNHFFPSKLLETSLIRNVKNNILTHVKIEHYTNILNKIQKNNPNLFSLIEKKQIEKSFDFNYNNENHCKHRL